MPNWCLSAKVYHRVTRSIKHQMFQQENAIKLVELDWQDEDERAVEADPWRSRVDWKKH
jgi:thiol:disulfide interchange protein